MITITFPPGHCESVEFFHTEWTFSTTTMRRKCLLTCTFDFEFRCAVSTTLGAVMRGLGRIGPSPLLIEPVAVLALDSGTAGKRNELGLTRRQQPCGIAWQVAVPFADRLEAHPQQLAAQLGREFERGLPALRIGDEGGIVTADPHSRHNRPLRCAVPAEATVIDARGEQCTAHVGRIAAGLAVPDQTDLLARVDAETRLAVIVRRAEPVVSVPADAFGEFSCYVHDAAGAGIAAERAVDAVCYPHVTLPRVRGLASTQNVPVHYDRAWLKPFLGRRKQVPGRRRKRRPGAYYVWVYPSASMYGPYGSGTMRYMKEVPGDKVRATFRDTLNEVEFEGEHVVVTRYGKPAAVMVSPTWYEQAKAALAEVDYDDRP